MSCCVSSDISTAILSDLFVYSSRSLEMGLRLYFRIWTGVIPRGGQPYTPVSTAERSFIFSHSGHY